MQGKGETWLEANECAARIGLSKRALRLYEEHGLIRPRRTQKGWRLYGADEIARLHEILALKRVGLSLQRITALLQGKAVDLAGILDIQHDLLADQRERAEQGLALVRAAQAKLAAGTSLTADELIRLAKEANMTETTTDTVAWILHQGGHDTVATRIDEAEAKRWGNELGERVRNRMPDPRSEATLREVLEQQQRGSIPFALLSEELAELVREQQPIVSAELESKGELQSLGFRRVREDGVDIYKAQFAKGVLRCGIGFGQDGRVHTLWMRPA